MSPSESAVKEEGLQQRTEQPVRSAQHDRLGEDAPRLAEPVDVLQHCAAKGECLRGDLVVRTFGDDLRVCVGSAVIIAVPVAHAAQQEECAARRGRRCRGVLGELGRLCGEVGGGERVTGKQRGPPELFERPRLKRLVHQLAGDAERTHVIVVR